MGAAHRFSDSELESMLQDIESDLVERKESLRGDPLYEPHLCR